MRPRKIYPLNQCPLYKLSSRNKLASIIGFDLATLERIGSNDSNYRLFKIRQGEKEREVEVPKRVLERIHTRLFALLSRIALPDYLHSGRKQRSYITNAKAHAYLAPLVKLDIRKFYHSVQGARIYRFFLGALKCSPDVSALLVKLCTVNGHVPTGSCVSQILAFFAAKPMFDELNAAAESSGVRFTCYVDDMTWSGERATPNLLWHAKQIIFRYGLEYHKEQVFLATEKKLVTGVVIDGDAIAVSAKREHQLWKDINALGAAEPEERLAALNRLIGVASASSQIEERFLRRVINLRRAKVALLKQHPGVVSSKVTKANSRP